MLYQREDLYFFSFLKYRFPFAFLSFVIGFMVQFLWEFILFVFNIRSQNYGDDFMRVVSTMLQDSLVETNLGMPYFYLIHKAVSKKFSDVPVIEKEV